MQILTRPSVLSAIVVEKFFTVSLDVLKKFFSLLDVFADATMLPLRHEILESLLDVTIKTDFCDETGDVAALVEHKVMPCVGGFIERQSVLSTTGWINAVGAE